MRKGLLILLLEFVVVPIYAQWQFDANNNAVTQTATQNVGIGTSSPPTQKLQVVGNILVSGSQRQLTLGNGQGMTDPGGPDLKLFASAQYSGGNITFFTLGGSGLVERMRIVSGGNVGVGSAIGNPLSVLHAGGDFTVGVGSTAGSTGNVQITTQGASPTSNRLTFGTDGMGWKFAIAKNQAGTVSDLMTVQDNGYVGIGTVSPLGRFHVQEPTHIPGSGAWGTAQLLGSDALAADKGGVLNFGGIYTSTGARADWAGMSGLKNNATEGDYGGYLALYTRTNGAGTAERMRIDSIGNTGIGVSAPTERLHVAGNILATGNISANGTIYAKYQDVAEWVDASSALEPATVVVLDPSHENQVMPSWTAYDTAVAGVVSASPGVVLGVSAAGKEKIATTGRVKVRVDASAAPIAIGDLLVTSGVPGMAMKSVPIDVGGAKIHRPGTVIGKALQALPGGRGEILVLLTLQ